MVAGIILSGANRGAQTQELTGTTTERWNLKTRPPSLATPHPDSHEAGTPLVRQRGEGRPTWRSAMQL